MVLYTVIRVSCTYLSRTSELTSGTRPSHSSYKVKTHLALMVDGLTRIHPSGAERRLSFPPNSFGRMGRRKTLPGAMGRLPRAELPRCQTASGASAASASDRAICREFLVRANVSPKRANQPRPFRELPRERTCRKPSATAEALHVVLVCLPLVAFCLSGAKNAAQMGSSIATDAIVCIAFLPAPLGAP